MSGEPVRIEGTVDYLDTPEGQQDYARRWKEVEMQIRAQEDDEGWFEALGAEFRVFPDKTVCASCGADAAHRCATCKVVAYCGEACRAKEWREHARTCAPATTGSMLRAAGLFRHGGTRLGFSIITPASTVFVDTQAKTEAHPWYNLADNREVYSFRAGVALAALQGVALLVESGRPYSFDLTAVDAAHPAILALDEVGGPGSKPLQTLGFGKVVTVTFDDTHRFLYFQCANHPRMGAPIIVVPPADA
jgi:hypothetical protein